MNKTIRYYLIAATIITLCGCASSVNGIAKPTVFTQPKAYVKKFKLGITKTELIGAIGIPSKSITIDGIDYLSYEMGKGLGKREYVYALKNGIVDNVMFYDKGPYNGVSSKGIE
jgi:hypothetical protein